MWSTYGLRDNLDPQNVFEDGFSFSLGCYILVSLFSILDFEKD